MFAIIRTGGKQYKVAEGDTLKVEKLPASNGKTVTFSDVLIIVDGEKIQVGTPTLEGAVVNAEVVKVGRTKKLRVQKYKSKVRYRRVHGHRQHYTEVKVTGISAGA